MKEPGREGRAWQRQRFCSSDSMTALAVRKVTGGAFRGLPEGEEGAIRVPL